MRVDGKFSLQKFPLAAMFAGFVFCGSRLAIFLAEKTREHQKDDEKRQSTGVFDPEDG